MHCGAGLNEMGALAMNALGALNGELTVQRYCPKQDDEIQGK